MLPACSAPAEPQAAGASAASGVEVADTQPVDIPNNPATPAATFKRLNLGSLIAGGAVDARHNAGWNNFPRKLTDGDTGTFKTTGADPVVLEFAFQQPTPVKAVRLFLSGVPQYAWMVRAGNDGLTLTADAAQAEGEDWSLIELPEAATTLRLRVEIRGSGSGQALSVHEVEVLGPP